MSKTVKKQSLDSIIERAHHIVAQLKQLSVMEDPIPFWVIYCLGIEYLGSFLDDKPLYAENQSRSRFYLSLAKLFPKKYYDANRKDYLYLSLRCMLIHRLVLTNDFVQVNEPKHLELTDGNRYFLNKETSILEFEQAIQKLKNRLEATF